jgi:hypothetical protein
MNMCARLAKLSGIYLSALLVLNGLLSGVSHRHHRNSVQLDHSKKASSCRHHCHFGEHGLKRDEQSDRPTDPGPCDDDCPACRFLAGFQPLLVSGESPLVTAELTSALAQPAPHRVPCLETHSWNTRAPPQLS